MPVALAGTRPLSDAIGRKGPFATRHRVTSCSIWPCFTTTTHACCGYAGIGDLLGLLRGSHLPTWAISIERKALVAAVGFILPAIRGRSGGRLVGGFIGEHVGPATGILCSLGFTLSRLIE